MEHRRETPSIVLLLLILVDVLRMPRQAANSTVSASVVPLDNLESVLVADGVAYVGSQHGTTYALRARDGSLLWRSQAAGQVVDTSDGIVYVSSPLDLLDRLTHKGHILEFVGESYRFRQRMKMEEQATETG